MSSNEYKAGDEIIYTFKHPDTGQEYQIIHAYKLYDNYENRLKENPSISPSHVFEEVVIEPIYDACFRDAEYSTEAIDFPDDLKQVSNLVKKMEEEKINNVVREALIKSSNYIPSSKMTNVCVFPSKVDYDLPFMFTSGSGKISVLYDKNTDEEMLRAGIAHEYHHSVWTEKYFNKESSMTVLDNIVLEGKAVMFEKVVYPNLTFTEVNYRYDKEDWEKIEQDLYLYDDYRAYEILYGGEGLPENYGYIEGYKMVRSFLDLQPNLTPEDWTALSAEEVFEEGNYLEYYKE